MIEDLLLSNDRPVVRKRPSNSTRKGKAGRHFGEIDEHPIEVILAPFTGDDLNSTEMWNVEEPNRVAEAQDQNMVCQDFAKLGYGVLNPQKFILFSFEEPLDFTTQRNTVERTVRFLMPAARFQRERCARYDH